MSDLAFCRARTRERSPAGPDSSRARLSAFTVLAIEGDPECFVGAANEYILARVIRDRRRRLPPRPAEVVRWEMRPLREDEP